VEITFDPAKNERNLRERGIDFGLAAEFDFDSAIFRQDTRKDYGEVRMRALGYIGETLHALVFTMRGSVVRVISLRKPSEGSEINMSKPNLDIPNPELIDEDNPEWADEDFTQAVPLSGLPQELQDLLSSSKATKPDSEGKSTRHPAA
jgi:uncharacterized DUF497 family protein